MANRNKVRQFINWIRERYAKVKKLDIKKSDIDRGIFIAEKLKQAVNSNALNVLVTITPTNIDNAIRDVLIKAIDDILMAFAIFGECSVKKTLEARLECAVSELRKCGKFDRHGMYLKIASLLKRNTSAFSSSTVQAMVQLRYDELKEGNLI